MALDWAAAETLLALGRPPVAAAEIVNYNAAVVEPAMPSDVIDLGLRFAPNPELLASLDPDLVLISPAQTALRPLLERFGPVEIMEIYGTAGRPYPLAREATTTVARRIGHEGEGVALVARADAAMIEARRRFHAHDGRPLYVIGFIDRGHIAVAGRRSLFHGVLDQLGLANAWPGDGNAWGSAYTVIESLLAAPEARLVYLSTAASEETRRQVFGSELWRRLPAVQAGRVAALPAIFPFGALPSAMRFAKALAATLTGPGADGGTGL